MTLHKFSSQHRKETLRHRWSRVRSSGLGYTSTSLQWSHILKLAHCLNFLVFYRVLSFPN